MPEVSFYQAVVLALLEQRNYFMVETFRYAQQYGQLPPLENNENESVTIKAEEEVPKAKEGFELKVLPPATEQPRVKFTKSYSDDDQS